MTTKDLLHIIQQGENEHLEAKSGMGDFPDSLWESYSAFVNTDGGIDVDRTTLLLPTNGQEPDEEALREFYDDVEIQYASDKTDDKQAIILGFLSSHASATTKQLSELLQLSMPRTRVYLDVLVKSQKITSHGANKNRTYSLKEETNI